MELKHQLCSLELAKRLKELGVKQEIMFYHWATDVEEDGLTWWTISQTEPRKGKRVRELSTPEHYRGPLSAFTVAELGEMLPHVENIVVMLFDNGHCQLCLQQTPIEGATPVFEAQSEADARAKMLIYLLEHNLVSK
jgi:hypothetical protein